MIVSATNVSSSSVRVSWSPPPRNTIHGEFLGYRIKYARRESPEKEEEIALKDPDLRVSALTAGRPVSAARLPKNNKGRRLHLLARPWHLFHQKTRALRNSHCPCAPVALFTQQFVIRNLETFAEYILSVQVFNPAGEGPAATVSVMTDEGSKLLTRRAAR